MPDRVPPYRPVSQNIRPACLKLKRSSFWPPNSSDQSGNGLRSNHKFVFALAWPNIDKSTTLGCTCSFSLRANVRVGPAYIFFTEIHIYRPQCLT